VGCGLELDRVFAVSDALFCLIGLDGTFVRVSPAWEGALGYGPTELQGQPVSRWVGAEDLARAAEAVRRRPHDNPVAFECGFRHRDGKDRRLRGRAVTTGGLVLVSVSVVGEGPADPARGAKAAFLAHVSHEVRTPLALILSNADLALEKGPDLPDADRDDYLRVIRRNAEELLGLLVDVLDLTRLESGDAPVEVVNCPLPALIEEVLEVVRFRAAPRGLDVVFEPLGPVPGVVRTDPDRLRQALRQVLTNAELLTDWGGVRLRFRHAAGPGVGDAPGRLVFEVSDTGGGLPPLEVGEAFPASDRAGSSRVRSIRSAGVGLALCRRLVEPLGGRLETWYSQGAGTVIALSLPVTAPPAPPPPEPEARPAVPAVGHTPGVPGAEGGPAGFDARALVAEDNPDNQKIVRMRLSMMGALVTVASNGLEAVELARAARDAGDPFDLILMDMQMPVLDGYGATRMLRDEGFRTPVVAMTAFAMPGDREECLSFGCDDYVSKPVDWKALQLLLARLLRAAPAG